MRLQHPVALPDETGNLVLVATQHRRQPAIDQIGRLRHLHVEARQERDGALRVEPGIADDPLVHGEEAVQAAMRIDAHGDKMVHGAVLPVRPDEAVEVAVLDLVEGRHMRMVVPLRAGQHRDVPFG